MTESLDFEGFSDLIGRLWPDYRTTDDMLHELWRGVSRFSADRLALAMREHRFAVPDARSPKWSAIRDDLYQGVRDEAKTTPFANLMKTQRRLIGECWQYEADKCKAAGWKPSNDWTDEDLWQNFLDAKTRPITHDARGRAHCDDLERRTRMAAVERNVWMNIWRDRMNAAGESLPYWMGGVRHLDAEPVERDEVPF